MSNALKAKRKKMVPLGYSKAELVGIQNYCRKNNRQENIIVKTYQDIKLISLQILHDKFGFGLKRISRLENGINQCLEKNADRDLGASHYEIYLKEKCDFSITEEINKIPYRERVMFCFEKFPDAKTAIEAGKLVAAAFYNYIALSCTVLKEAFKVSGRQLLEYIEWIRYYVNSIATRRETMLGVASVLYYECKYLDARFEGKFYEV